MDPLHRDRQNGKSRKEKLLKVLILYLEREPLEQMAKKRQLIAFKHKGFWQCMDTKRDKDKLDKILKSKKFKF